MLKFIRYMTHATFILRAPGLSPEIIAVRTEQVAGQSALSKGERISTRIGFSTRRLIFWRMKTKLPEVKLVCAHGLKRGISSIRVLISSDGDQTIIKGSPADSIVVVILFSVLWIILGFFLLDTGWQRFLIILSAIFAIIGFVAYRSSLRSECREFFENLISDDRNDVTNETMKSTSG